MADQIKDPADAGSHREFADNPIVKSILNGTPRPAVTPLKVESEAPSETESEETKPEPGQAEPAGKSGEPVEKQSQEKKEERKEGAEARRIKALNAEAKAHRERAERAEARLAELERGAPKAEPAKPEVPKADVKEEDAKPKLADFEKDSKYKTYGDAIEAYNDARDAWRERQSEKKSKEDSERQKATERQTSVQTRLSKAREKYSDFNEKVNAGIQATEGIRNQGIEAALNESEAIGDVLYHLVNNLDEYRRIAALSPEAAYREILRLEIHLSGEQPPEQPTEPKIVSRAPAPIERASGNSVNLDRDPQKATSQRDFEQKLSPALREMAGFPKRR